jgi:hypothetical protein
MQACKSAATYSRYNRPWFISGHICETKHSFNSSMMPNTTQCVVETVPTVKNSLHHWRIESIILFLYVDLEKPMIASIAHVRDVIGML